MVAVDGWCVSWSFECGKAEGSTPWENGVRESGFGKIGKTGSLGGMQVFVTS